MAMHTIDEYLDSIENPDHRARLVDVLAWTRETFPQLELVVKWNQPMLLDHGTFIVGFSVAKKHLACAPEGQTVEFFADDLTRRGIDFGKKFIRLPWAQPFPYDLLTNIISHNIADKHNCTSFWR